MRYARQIGLGVIAAVLGLAPHTAVAGPFEDAGRAYDRGDYATAARLYRGWAEQGHADAQDLLGAMYEAGIGVRQDYAAAAKWYRKAADQGYPSPQNSLGAAYFTGHGVEQDYGKAVKWYRRAADQGHAKAQYNLGLMYRDGKGVPQDFVAAHLWLNLAAARLAPGAERDNAARSRDAVAAAMTPAQVAEAQGRASAWRPKVRHKPAP
jgi:TPR repeat protein